MVDQNDVFLEIKINYKGQSKEIKTANMLTIDEIKDEIEKKFGINKCDKNKLELFYKNKKIVENDNIFYLSEEKNEYLYFLEINLIYNDETDELKKEIEQNKEKIKKLKIQIMKLKLDMEHKKKKKELINKIKIKKINKLKQQIINEIMPKIKLEIKNNNDMINNEIINNNILNKLNENINIKKEILKTEIEKEIKEKISPLEEKTDKIMK
jgi:hypothetical protein